MIDKSYLYVCTAIISGYLGNIMSKQSLGFTKIIPSLLAIILVFICICSYTMALKNIPLGLAFITYSISLILLITLTGICFYKEKYNYHTILGIILILIGLVNIYINKKS